MSKNKYTTPSVIYGIAINIYKGKAYDEVAAEIGISKQRVGQIVARLRKHGVMLPNFKHNQYGKVIGMIRKEHPEMMRLK